MVLAFKIASSHYPMSLRKDFSSLRKQRYSGGVQPRNLLGLSPSPTRISIPTNHKARQVSVYVVKPFSVHSKEQTDDVKTCFFLPISITVSGLNETPTLHLNLLSVDYNGTKIIGSDDLELRVSKNREYVYFTKADAYIDKMVIPQGTVELICFSNDGKSLLILLQKNFGFFYLKHSSDDSRLLEFFLETSAHWGATDRIIRSDSIQQSYELEASKRAAAQRDPQTLVHVPNSPVMESEDDEMLQNGLLSIPSATSASSKAQTNGYHGPRTRAVTKDPELKKARLSALDKPPVDDDDDEPIEHEVPAPFDPPLKQTLSNGKKFVVAYNDFKTLYNNDWINDTLIDYFIASDLDNAVTQLCLVKEKDVYAFNSFFFTKLMSRQDENEVPDYYQNIRRWLGKLDLMSYSSVIIPVNENLHWYCCLIKNLPQMLASVKSNEGLTESTPVAEIYIIDSLILDHENIEEPLRKVIIEYCKEKHNVEVPSTFITFHRARVPRQLNFNDCGIHVIYNVKKWLSNPEIFEDAWKCPPNKRGYLKLYSKVERNAMRRTLIDALINLHKVQPLDDSSNLAKGTDEAQSDDEIEVISYYSSKHEEEKTEEKAESKNLKEVLQESKEIGKTEKGSESKTSTPAPSTGEDASKLATITNSQQSEVEEVLSDDERETPRSLRANTPIRTLDPRVIDTSSPNPKLAEKARTFLQIEHPQIRRLCMRVRIMPHTIMFLNEYFQNHAKKYDEAKQKSITAFVDKYNFFDPKVEARQSDLLVRSLRESLKEPIAPMEEPFVIEADDSGGALNRSVGDLRLSDEPKKYSRKHGTGDSARTTRHGDSRQKVSTRHFIQKDALDVLDDVQVVEPASESVDLIPANPSSFYLSPTTLEKRKPDPEIVTIPDENKPPKELFLGIKRSPTGLKRRRVDGRKRH